MKLAWRASTQRHAWVDVRMTKGLQLTLTGGAELPARAAIMKSHPAWGVTVMAVWSKPRPIVMAGLDPAIHVFLRVGQTWMPGSRPGMTAELNCPWGSSACRNLSISVRSTCRNTGFLDCLGPFGHFRIKSCLVGGGCALCLRKGSGAEGGETGVDHLVLHGGL